MVMQFYTEIRNIIIFLNKIYLTYNLKFVIFYFKFYCNVKNAELFCSFRKYLIE